MGNGSTINEVFVNNLESVGGSNKAISVGFQGIQSLPGLTEWYKAVVIPSLSRSEKEQQSMMNAIHKLVDKGFEETNKNSDKNSDKVVNESRKLNSTLEKLSDQEKKDKRNTELKSYLTQALKLTAKGASMAFDRQIQLANIFRDIESSGVYIADGFKSLGDSANEAHMTYDQFAKGLAKMSPIIAKLNGSMGSLSNGVKTFSRSMNALDNKYGLTNEESQAVFESVINSLSPDQLRNMTQEQLNVELDKTAKSMKELSLATGKSVEAITKETELKNQAIRVQAFGQTHQNAFKTMKAMGLDNDMIDYVLSGGTKTSGKLTMKLSNDPMLRGVLKEMMKLNAQGDWGADEIRANGSKYLSAADIKKRDARTLGANTSSYAAMGSSVMFEALADTSTNNSVSTFLANSQKAKLPGTDGDQTRQELLKNQQNTVNHLNELDNALLNLRTGGVEAVTTSLGVMDDVIGVASASLEKLDGFLDNYIPSWARMALVVFWNIAEIAIPNIINLVGDRVIEPLVTSIIGTIMNHIKHPLASLKADFTGLCSIIKIFGRYMTIVGGYLKAAVAPIAKSIAVYEAIINILDEFEQSINKAFSWFFTRKLSDEDQERINKIYEHEDKNTVVKKYLPGYYFSSVQSGSIISGFEGGVVSSLMGKNENDVMAVPANQNYNTINTTSVQNNSTIPNASANQSVSELKDEMKMIKKYTSEISSSIKDYMTYIKTKPNLSITPIS